MPLYSLIWPPCGWSAIRKPPIEQGGLRQAHLYEPDSGIRRRIDPHCIPRLPPRFPPRTTRQVNRHILPAPRLSRPEFPRTPLFQLLRAVLLLIACLPFPTLRRVLPRSESLTSEYPIIRPESMSCAEITSHKPTSDYRSACPYLDYFQFADSTGVKACSR